MTRAEAIREACSIVGMAYHAIGDYSRACDCFCPARLQARIATNEAELFDFFLGTSWSEFRHDPDTLAYVRKAVEEKLARDGFIATEVPS